MNPIAYLSAIWPRLVGGAYSHPYYQQFSSPLEAESFKRGVLDVLRAVPPPGVDAVVVQCWAYRQVGGWTLQNNDLIPLAPLT